MKFFLAMLAFLLAIPRAHSAPLTAWGALPSSFTSQINNSGFFVKGSGVNTWYALEVDPTTGLLPVSGTLTFSGLLAEDHNYGTVGSNTLRTAAQVGNASGAADFGAGAVTAQTLRSVSVLYNGASAASFGAGTTGSNSLRVVLPTDQTAIPVTQSGSWAVTANIGTTNGLALDATVSQSQGTVAAGTAATKSTLAGAVYNSSLPTLVNGQQAAIQADSNARQIVVGAGVAGTAAGGVVSVQGVASGTPLPISGTVTANIGTTNGLALDATVSGTQGTVAAGTAATKSTLTGGVYNTSLPTLTTGQQAATQLDSSGRVILSPTTTIPVSVAAAPLNPTGRTSTLLFLNNYATTNVTTSAYVQVVASTNAIINKLYVFDSSGSAMILATGGSGSEVAQLYIPPGGSSAGFELAIPASTRIAIKALDTSATSGEIIITALQ